jgi:hypothetical protein
MYQDLALFTNYHNNAAATNDQPTSNAGSPVISLLDLPVLYGQAQRFVA